MQATVEFNRIDSFCKEYLGSDDDATRRKLGSNTLSGLG